MSWVSNGFVATGEAVWRLCIFTTKISSIGVLRNMGGWTSMERLGLEGAVVPGPSLDVCVVVVLVSRWLLSSGPRHCLAAGLPVEGGLLCTGSC